MTQDVLPFWGFNMFSFVIPISYFLPVIEEFHTKKMGIKEAKYDKLNRNYVDPRIQGDI